MKKFYNIILVSIIGLTVAIIVTAFNNPTGNPTTGGGAIYADSSGNVGIGTTDPGTRKLKVNGAFEATTLYGDGSNLTGVGGGAEHAITRGFELTYGNIQDVLVEPGTLYHGSTKVNKTARTSGLNLTNDANWIDGSKPASLSNIWIYVYVSADGSIKYHEEAPNKADTDGNTEGKLIYYYYPTGGTYWRWIGQIRTDSGSDILKFYQRGDWIYYDNPYGNTTLRVINQVDVNVTTWTAVDCSAVAPSTSKLIKLNLSATLGQSSGANNFNMNFRLTGSSATEGIFYQERFYTYPDSSDIIDIPTNSSQSFDYKASIDAGVGGTQTLYVYAAGYYNPRN